MAVGLLLGACSGSSTASGTSDSGTSPAGQPASADPCSDYCARADACTPGFLSTCLTLCADNLDFVGQQGVGPACRVLARSYLRCIAGSANTHCTQTGSISAPDASECEALGEESVGCKSSGAFVRSAGDDSKCAAKGLPPRGFIAKEYGNGGCRVFNGTSVALKPGDLECCDYP